VFRNVDRLFNHLASLSEGLGKSSGCAHVKSAAPAVQTKYAAEIVSRAWALVVVAGVLMKQKHFF
jgi:hypothetical protein